jgi:DNA-binding transcriptional LysR family regulator
VVDLRRLRYFVTVAEERNFTRAAERLHVAQPALSRQVRLLEEELGVELMHRTTHVFELTEAGRYLFEHAPALLDTADALEHAMRGFGAGDLGQVIVAYGTSAGYETAPRLLAAIAERLPELEVRTRVMSSGDIVAGLGDGSIDVGLVRCPEPLPGLESRLLRLESQGVLVHRSQPLASQEHARLGDLRDETVLIHPREANPGHYDAVVGLLRKAGIEPRLKLRGLSFDLAQTPVLQGAAVAVVGESSCVGLPEELRWVPLAPRAALDVRLLARKSGRPPVVSRLLDMAEAVADGLGWREPTPA